MCTGTHLGGRPTKLTDELADRLVATLRETGNLAGAARSVGVSRRAVYDWLERGRSEPHGRLLARIEAARAAVEAPEPSWEASAALLEAEYGEWRVPELRPLDDVLGDFD